VTVTDPAHGAVGVAEDATISVTFSKAIDVSTVKQGDSVRVGQIGGGAEVFGTTFVVPGSGDRVLELVPDDLLAASTTYTILVSTRLRSVDGEAVGGGSAFSFQTGGGFGLPGPANLRETANRLSVGRRSHAATLLLDGRVLVTGGFVQGTMVTDRAERFHPATESFTLLPGVMTQPRAGHSATRLGNGRVLLAGGWYEISPGTLNAAWTAEVYDPATATFSPVGNMRKQRVDHAAHLLPDGRVLVTGGSVNSGMFLEDHDDAEVFDPATGTWSDWPHLMTHARATHGMVDMGDGRWLLAGGSDTDLRPDVFTVATGRFTPVAQAAEDYGRFGAAMDRFTDGDVAIVGGEAVGSVLHFDRQASFLLNTGSGTDRPRAYGTVTRFAPDKMLVAGGLDFGNGGFVLPTTDLIVQGGPGGSRTYRTPMAFPTGMASHTATLLNDGRVLFCGGLNSTGGMPELTGGYLFTP
jgi:hypothetical protein